MIGIEAIAVELPGRRVATGAIASAVGLEHGALLASVGFKSLGRAPEEQDASDLCAAAATTLFSTEGISADTIECAAVVSQSPVGYGIPHTAAILQPKLGLPVSCACFDIGLGGSGYIHGLAVLKGFMESNGFSRGLLFTCDLYSR
ncbi:MAG: hypothetical protein OSA97_17200, partial [Nevskia sp.]|nr:hypothetical protein [Nevskia sp.]